MANDGGPPPIEYGQKRLKSASKPIKTAGNCTSVNPTSIFFWGKGPDSPPNSRAQRSCKASGKSGFSCRLMSHFQTPGSVAVRYMMLIFIDNVLGLFVG